MRPYLTLAVSAPLASFGEVAPNERRGTATRPTRSALLGLVGGALGLRRDEREALSELTAGYGVASSILPGSQVILDYHTVQSPSEEAFALPKPKGHPKGMPAPRRTFADRGYALHAARPDTLLTRRDYLCDVHVAVALWTRGTARWSLDDLAAALRRPVFTPYLGRLSCPLSAPMSPAVADAADAVAALARVRFMPDPGEGGPDGAGTWVARNLDMRGEGQAFAALDADDPAASQPERVGHDRNDMPRHDTLRRFGSRREWVVPMPPPRPYHTEARDG